MCKHSDMFSLAILIGRGLDLFSLLSLHLLKYIITLCSVFRVRKQYAPLAQLGEPPKRCLWQMKRGGEVKKQGAMRCAPSKQCDYVSEGRAPDSANETCEQYAPLAQLVEHLTLNQGVQGSSP